MSNKRPELTNAIATELAGAIARLQQLGDSTIINPATEAEVIGLRKFIANTASAHADELVACWFAVHFEYEPLVQGFTGLLSRAQALSNRRNQPQQSAPIPEPTNEAEKPGNVVPLTGGEAK